MSAVRESRTNRVQRYKKIDKMSFFKTLDNEFFSFVFLQSELLPVHHLDLILHMGAEVVAAEDLDVVVEAQDEARHALETAHFRFQQEAAAVRLLQERRGEGVFFCQQAGGAHRQAQPHRESLRAVHPENIHIAGFMAVFMLPARLQHLHLLDPRHLEGLHHLRIQLEAPHLVVVGGEGVGLHQAVGGGVAVGGTVARQEGLPAPVDGGGEVVEVLPCPLAHPEVDDDLVVIDGVQLLFQGFLRLGVGGDGVDGAAQDHLLLFGKVEQFAEVPRHLVGGGFDPIDVVLVAFHGETRLAEGVDVAEEGPLAEAETLADLLLVHISVVGEEHQQLQLAHDSRLVHGRVF